MIFALLNEYEANLVGRVAMLALIGFVAWLSLK